MGMSTLVPIRNVSIQSDEFFGAVHIYDFLLTNVLYLIYICSCKQMTSSAMTSELFYC